MPDGTYTVTYWDDKLNYILDLVNVTVNGGETVDMGILPLAGWWTRLEGDVFNDLNRNGKRDTGEPGIANFTVVMKKRENSVMDRGAKAVTTDATGHYVMENLYPLTQWLVVEAYSDLYYTTGVTWQADNQPTETTVLGAGVDVGVLPIIGLSGRLDWGVHAYDPTGASGGIDPRNGGIVGTVSYDTTRNELDPAFAAVEDWQPGVPGLTVNLWAPVPCTAASLRCDPTGRYEVDLDGAYTRGALLNQYVTERWSRPRNCQARDVDGNPLLYPGDQQFMPPATGDYECLEAPAMGVQFEAGFSAVDGNYGFGDGCFQADATRTPGTYDPVSGACTVGELGELPARDYLVQVEIPTDLLGRPAYQFTREEDINIFRGDQWVPQVPPPPCAGPLHTVDVAGSGTDGYPETGAAQRRDGAGLQPGLQPDLRRRRRHALRRAGPPALRHQAGAGEPGALHRPVLQPVHRGPGGRAALHLHRRRPQLLARPAVDPLRREGRRAPRAGRDLRLHQPAGAHRRVGLQRHLRRPPAVDRPDLLPDARPASAPTSTGSSATTPASPGGSTPTTTRASAPSPPSSRSSRA